MSKSDAETAKAKPVYKCALVVVIGVNAYMVVSIEIVELFFIFFHHANIRVPNEDALSQVIITPSLHRTHHSTLRKEHDSNYGIVLSVWDRLFGTRKELVPENIGLDLIGAENFIQLFSLAFITERKIMKLFSWIPKGKK
jgi:sterol desaturase/sphingolipid hydroxylase (fatty acid hydroxylase superfamily)